MSDRTRAWKLLRSFEWALVIGGLAGVLAIGLLYNQAIGSLGSRASLLAGAGIGAGLTLVLTYVFDQISKLVGSLRRTIRGRGAAGSSKKERQK